MKKLCRRIVMLTAMLVLVYGVSAFADTRQYSAKTLSLPNSYGGSSWTGAGWSNQFTLSTSTNINVGISMMDKYATANYYNSNLYYVFQNVLTGVQYTLSGKDYSSYYYTMETDVPAGTYAFGVYYSGTYSQRLYFNIFGSSGIKVPDKLEVVVGKSTVVSVFEENTSYAGIVNKCHTTNDNVAMVTNINNNVTPPQLTVQGMGLGTCTITVYGSDGSTDVMTVNVVSKSARPTLLYTSLTLNGGESVYNEVLNLTGTVTWSTNKSSVATVTKKGKIKAKGYGKCTITATVKQNGQTYQLDCGVTVTRSDPMFYAYISSVKPGKKKLYIKMNNRSGVDMTVYSSGAWLYENKGDGELYRSRKLKLSSGKTVTIQNKKTKRLKFTIKGETATTTLANSVVRIKFKVDGNVYYAMVYPNQLLGIYILKQNYVNGTDKWLSSY